MARPATKPRTPQHRRMVVATIALGILATTAVACRTDKPQLEDFYYLNRERVAGSVGMTAWDDKLAAKAQAWAQHMADTGTLAHSTLTDGVPGGWNHLGENVGTGPAVGDVHDGFMNSTPHRTTMLSGQYSKVGVGVAERDGNVWVAEVYEG